MDGKTLRGQTGEASSTDECLVFGLLPRDHLQAWADWVRVGVCDVVVADGSTV